MPVIDSEEAFGRSYEFEAKTSGPTREAFRCHIYTSQAECSLPPATKAPFVPKPAEVVTPLSWRL
jgi:hypothetical protein